MKIRNIFTIPAVLLCMSVSFPVFADNMDFARYEKYLKQSVESAGLPETVAYLPLVLTNADPLYDNAGASGIWAVTAPVARHYGVTVAFGYDARYDVEYSTVAALGYIGDLYRSNGRDLAAALGQYVRVTGQSGKADYILGLLSKAVEDYAAGLDSKSEQTVSVTLQGDVLADGLCQSIGITGEWLSALNPAVRKDVSFLPEGAVLRIPSEKIGDFAAAAAGLYASAKDSLSRMQTALDRQKQSACSKTEVSKRESVKGSNTVYYKIKSGDSLGKIAKRYGVSVSQIKKWNNLRSDSIQAGKTLKICK